TRAAVSRVAPGVAGASRAGCERTPCHQSAAPAPDRRGRYRAAPQASVHQPAPRRARARRELQKETTTFVLEASSPHDSTYDSSEAVQPNADGQRRLELAQRCLALAECR